MYKARTHYQADTVAEAYEAQRFRSLRGRWVDWLEKQRVIQALVGLRPSSLILDAPVGTGRIAAALEQAGWRVMGADISAAMLQQSRLRHVAQSGLARADVEHLPFKDGAFDGAVSYRLMAHLPGPSRQAMLHELARVTKGPIVINYHLSRTSILWAVNRVARRSALAAYPVTANDVRAEVDTCGLRIIAVRPLLLGVLDSYLYVLQR
jgi:ubiquinone/menaquinone biosynthesis C-methylase UbiE